jgi:hypothetical protein
LLQEKDSYGIKATKSYKHSIAKHNKIPAWIRHGLVTWMSIAYVVVAFG